METLFLITGTMFFVTGTIATVVIVYAFLQEEGWL